MAERLVRINNFSGGESGTLGDQGVAGTWSGRNMQVYKNGTLGIRPGFTNIRSQANIVPSGGQYYGAWWAPAVDRSTFPNGFILTAHENDSAQHRINRWRVDTGTEINTNMQTNAFQPTNPRWQFRTSVSWDNPSHLIVEGVDDYIVDAPSSSAITHLNPQDPRQSMWFKDRTYFWIGRDGGAPGRVSYSDASTHATMSANAFFDLGPADVTIVKHCIPVKDGLLIYTQDNDSQGYATWYILTGASPRTGNLRRLYKGRGPKWWNQVGVLDESAYFFGGESRGITTVNGSGQNDVTLDHLLPGGTGYDADASIRQAVICHLENAIILPYSLNAPDEIQPASGRISWLEGAGAMSRINGVWVREHWYNGDQPNDPDDHYGVLATYNMDDDKIGVLWCDDDSGVAQVFEMHTRDVCLNRPGKVTGDVFAQNVDSGASALLGDAMFPEIRGEAGESFTVTRVEIDIDYWKDSGTIWGPPTLEASLVYTGNVIAGKASDNATTTVFGSSSLTSLDDAAQVTPERTTISKNVTLSKPSKAVTFLLRSMHNVAIREIRVWLNEESPQFR